MVNKVDSIELLQAGMKASALRQQAIANNIANINTPGYKRTDVQFENVLAKALDDGKLSPGELDTKFFHPLSTPTDATGNDVELETEVGELIQNDATYKTLARLLAKKYRGMEMAMRTEG